MLRAEWTGMAIAFAVAVFAMSFLAIDATVDVKSAAVARRVEMAQASIMNAAIGQHQLAFALHAWACPSHQQQYSAID